MAKLLNIFFKNDRPDHLKALDGLRGIAVLFVLLSHSSKVGVLFSESLDFSHCAKYGIYLFFVLSAYLLDRQIGSALLENKADKGFWKSYFKKRILRIYPMYIAALFLFGVLNYWGFDTVIDKLEDIPLHLLLIKGESIFWSIPVEFKYYILSPLILWICHRFLKWNFTGVVTVISILIIIPMIFHYLYRLPHGSTFSFLPVFLTGTFIAIAEILKKDFIKVKISPVVMDTSGILCFSLVILSIPHFFYTLTGMEFNFLRPLLYVPYSLCWGMVLLSSKYGSGIMKRFLELKILRFIGVISYSVYLLHIPVLVYISGNDDVPQGAKVYVFFIVTMICSSITYLVIERPALKLSFSSTQTFP